MGCPNIVTGALAVRITFDVTEELATMFVLLPLVLLLYAFSPLRAHNLWHILLLQGQI